MHTRRHLPSGHAKGQSLKWTLSRPTGPLQSMQSRGPVVCHCKMIAMPTRTSPLPDLATALRVVGWHAYKLDELHSRSETCVSSETHEQTYRPCSTYGIYRCWRATTGCCGL